MSLFSEGTKLFKLSDPEFNMSSYMGRFMSLYKSQNPAMFFIQHSKILEAKKMIDDQ